MNRSMALRPSDLGTLLVIQFILAAVVVGFFLFSRDGAAAQAAAYGGGMALLLAWMLGRRALRAAEAAKTHPGSETFVIYMGAIQRFVVVLVLFALGMGWLALEPVPLLVAFAAAQLGHLINSGRISLRAGSGRMEKLG